MAYPHLSLERAEKTIAQAKLSQVRKARKLMYRAIAAMIEHENGMDDYIGINAWGTEDQELARALLDVFIANIERWSQYE